MSKLTELTQHKDFNDLFDKVADGFVRQWKAEESVEGRERAWLKVRILSEVKMALLNAAQGMSDGRG